MKLKQFYTSKLDSTASVLSGLKRQDRAFSIFRLITGSLMILSIYFALLKGSLIVAAAFIVSAFVFVTLVVLHTRLRKRISFNDRIKEVLDEELSYLNGDLTGFDEGNMFKDPSHLYADDLDVFGRGSLYQRIARVSSAEAKNRLAERLKNNNATVDVNHQSAVKELAAIPDFRIKYRALSKGLTTDDLHVRIVKWNQLDAQRSFLLNPVFSWTMSTVFPISVILILVFQRYDLIDWLLLPFGLNLFLFSRLLKSLRRDQTYVDRIVNDLNAHRELIKMIIDQTWSSRTLSALQSQLQDQESAKSLTELARIVGQLDSLNNMFGASLFNGMFLFHAHVYRALLKWKKTHGQNLLNWLDVQSEMEVWVGLSSFAFNHPDFSYPELSTSPDFSASEIGHPFIEEGKRVTNDLTFDGFKLVILTGSNMAGKSTFLRSLGINIILAKLGLPVCAKSLRLSQMQLLTSMKPQDSLNDNQSYFQAEITRLKVLVDNLDQHELSFILLDEILRGTNSEDKRNGTIGFLEKINSKKLMGLIATHDIEIAELTAENPQVYSNKFFESYQKDGDLVFDYVLRDGVCHTPNATQLMKLKGII